jgi:hypothetical protein
MPNVCVLDAVEVVLGWDLPDEALAAAVGVYSEVVGARPRE